MGWPVGHSLSPALHGAAFAALGLDYAYVPLPVAPDRVADAVRGLRALGFRGANVTIPHKAAVIPYLDWLERDAELAEAVNTIVVEDDGTLRGYNTDIVGFLNALDEVTGASGGLGATFGGTAPPPAAPQPAAPQPVAPQPAAPQLAAPQLAGPSARSPQAAPAGPALILGAGGAARAAALALARRGIPLTIVNRTAARAERLRDLISSGVPGSPVTVVPWGGLDKALVRAHALIVNATSLGMAGAVQVPRGLADNLIAGQIVVDFVYTGGLTGLLAQAQAQGATIVDGLSVLVWQAAAAFELWTGMAAPLEVMCSAVGRQGALAWPTRNTSASPGERRKGH
ncbi:MAG TPA: shikimate dehydrogenase [Thermoleophilia bacterium]|nr:shikimate dehydrogenase [Thermoleophilia bacterium]